MNSDKALIGKIGTVVIMLMIIAATFPAAISALNEEQTTDVEQEVDVETNIGDSFNSTISTYTTTEPYSVTFSLDDGSDIRVFTVDEGNSTTVTLSGSDVNVTVNDVRSDSASIRYEYPKTMNWAPGASAMYGLLGFFFLLGPVLYVASLVDYDLR